MSKAADKFLREIQGHQNAIRAALGETDRLAQTKSHISNIDPREVEQPLSGNELLKRQDINSRLQKPLLDDMSRGFKK